MRISLSGMQEKNCQSRQNTRIFLSGVQKITVVLLSSYDGILYKDILFLFKKEKSKNGNN